MDILNKVISNALALKMGGKCTFVVSLVHQAGLISLVLSMAFATKLYVDVVEFPTETKSFEKVVKQIEPDKDLATREFTGCLRFMLRFGRGYQMINNGQITVEIYDFNTNIGFITIQPWNNSTTLNASYSRMFRFCKHFNPGLWISICFSTKFTDSEQIIKIVQDGDLCEDKTYEAKVNGWIYFSKPMLARHM